MEPKGSSRLHGSLWSDPIGLPVLCSPVPFPSPLKPSPAPRPGPSKHCQCCVLLYWPPPHTCLTSTPASSPPGCDRLPAKCPALQPSLELPPHWGRSYKSTKHTLLWFLYLPLSLQTAALPLKQGAGTTSTLWELVRHVESWAHSDLLPQGLHVIKWFLHLWKFGKSGSQTLSASWATAVILLN